MLELPDLTEVGKAHDRMKRFGYVESATLGRHANDETIGFYVQTPGGFDLEIGCDSKVIDPATWVTTRHESISVWGHEWGWQKAMKAQGEQAVKVTEGTLDKRMSAAEIVAQLSDGMTLGIGGWGPRRKPMALVREILRSDLKDLTIVAYGGADVGMLCAAGKVRKLVFAFVSLDAIPLEPWFRKAREAGQIEVLELDEGMFQWGLKAAAFGLPFLPTRVGLGTDLAELGG